MRETLTKDSGGANGAEHQFVKAALCRIGRQRGMNVQVGQSPNARKRVNKLGSDLGCVAVKRTKLYILVGQRNF